MSEACKICKNEQDNIIFIAQEKMFNIKEQFQYLACAKCGCLQIKNIPTDVEKYYPSDYYSYNIDLPLSNLLQLIKDYLKRVCITWRIYNSGIIGNFSFSIYKDFPWIMKGKLHHNSSILDVGCGNGNLLLWMHRFGFKKLKGIDPYIEKDIEYPTGISIKKCFLQEETGLYDFIMLHHSFEHMENPWGVFKEIYRLLDPKGYALIRIPVAQSYAWRKYKTNWVQLDAPRHFFIHSVQSMSILAEEAGLKLTKVMYDSNALQFVGSEKYLRNIPFAQPDTDVFTKKEIRQFSKAATLLNRTNDGDSACFFFTKN